MSGKLGIFLVFVASGLVPAAAAVTPIPLEIQEYKSREIIIDVPHPGTGKIPTQHFLTLGSTDETFTIGGQITQIICYDGSPEPPLTEVSQTADGTVYKAKRPGYFGLDADVNGAVHRYYVFVSPVDSKHSDREDVSWYRTLFNSGTKSNNGPAAAAMAFSWATGAYLPVSTVCQEIGWRDDGAVSFQELMRQMSAHKVATRIVPVSTLQDLFTIIDRGNIAIIVFRSAGVKYNRNPTASFFDRYYPNVGDNYAVVKGYSKDGKYVVVYDPIPSDNVSNSFRHADGISMIGRNRYYSAGEIVSSLKSREAIEIMKPGQAVPSSGLK